MDWKDLLSKITNNAPAIGSLLGAPGEVAGTVIKLVASTLGVEPTQDAITAAISTNPDALVKLKDLEMTHQIELQKLMLESERIRLADVADARAREKAIVTRSGHVDINLYILAWVMVIGFFALMSALIEIQLPKDSTGVVFMLFGTLSTSFGAVIQYFFGSSASSAAKTTLLAQSQSGAKAG